MSEEPSYQLDTNPSPPDAIVIPADLRGAHSIVRATRDAATGARAEADGRITIGPSPGLVYCQVTRDALQRGLLVVQALLTEAERRAWGVVSLDKGYSDRAGAGIAIRGHEYRVELHEKVETLDFTEQEIVKWRSDAYSWQDRTDELPPPQLKLRRATGRLGLMLPNGYGGGRASWNEGPRGTLETKLPSILETLELRADEDDIAAAMRAAAAEERRIAEDQREARAQQHRIEQARLERLLAETQAWRRARDIDDYVRASALDPGT
jgi:hypothetical protein